MSPNDVAISANNLSLFTAQTVLVQRVNLTLRFGECAALIGASGVGKSITAQAVCGIHTPQITQTGAVNRAAPAAYLPQDAHACLDPLRTVRWHLLQCLTDTQDATTILSLLDSLGLSNPSRVLDLYPHQLSGGMARRITLAQCLLSDHKILIIDEPTSALDGSSIEATMSLIRTWLTPQRAMLILTHNPFVATTWCSRLFLMEHGTIVEECSTSAFAEANVCSDMGKRYHAAWRALHPEALRNT